MSRPLEGVLWLLLCASFMALALSTPLKGELFRREGGEQAWMRLNLNRAEAPDLMALPGMTFRKAHALVNARAKHGEFKTIDDLSAVPGFTRNYVYRIQDLLEVRE